MILSLSHGKAILLLIETDLKLDYSMVLQFNSKQRATNMKTECMRYILDRGRRRKQEEGVGGQPTWP